MTWAEIFFLGCAVLVAGMAIKDFRRFRQSPKLARVYIIMAVTIVLIAFLHFVDR